VLEGVQGDLLELGPVGIHNGLQGVEDDILVVG